MSTNDVGKLLMMIKAYYPTWKPELPMEMIANAWVALLKDYDAEQINKALLMYVSKGEHFPPSNPGELISLLVESETETDTEMQAWDMVYQAIKHGNYSSQEWYEKLPPTVQRAVGSPDQIKAWAAMDSDEVNSVVQSNFMRSYRAALKREQFEAKVPENVRCMIKTSEPIAIEVKEPEREEWREEGTPMPEGFMKRFEALMAGGADE